MTTPTMTSRLTIDHLRAIGFWQRVELDVRRFGPLGYCWAMENQQDGGYSGVGIPGAVTGLGRWTHMRGHRVAMCLTLGRVLEPDETVDHLCRNISCVKPAHLDVVPLAENIARGAAWRRQNRR